MLLAKAELLLLILVKTACPALRCNMQQHQQQMQFHLVRECQRSRGKILILENTATFEACVQLAFSVRGMALNYKNTERQRKITSKINEGNSSIYNFNINLRQKQSIFEQPQEFFNCHVLLCPENASFASMVNDSRFDYYSLYGRPLALSSNYSCQPEVGLFKLFTTRSTFVNATNSCANSTEFYGALAHIASANRTNALASMLQQFNSKSAEHISLAYVDLHFNRSLRLGNDFRNAANESLLCFLYSAWDVMQPERSLKLSNESCVALTPAATWRTVECKLQLPFICEIFTAPLATNQIDISLNAARVCNLNFN